MTNLELFLLINSIIFILLGIFVYKKHKHFNSTVFVFFSWIIASIFGFLYVFDCDYYIGKGPAKIESLIVFFILFLIFIIQLINFKGLSDDNYKYENSNFIQYVCLFVSIIAVIPFVENFLHLFNGKTITQMGGYHDNQNAIKIYDRLSFIGVKFSIILNWFKYIIPVLLFNYIHKDNKQINSFICIGLLMAFFNHSISSFCVGARFVVVQDGFLFIYLFLLYKNIINIKWRNNIYLIGSIIGGLLITGLFIISLYRFGDSENETLLQSFYRYLGEGFNNFHTDMWYVDSHTFGGHIFRGILGLEPFFLSMITGVRMHVYYTFIGDFICDFGVVLTGVLFIIISICVKFLLKHKMNFNKVIILSLYMNILLTGYMYIPYMNSKEDLYFLIIFILVISFINKRKVIRY